MYSKSFFLKRYRYQTWASFFKAFEKMYSPFKELIFLSISPINLEYQNGVWLSIKTIKKMPKFGNGHGIILDP